MPAVEITLPESLTVAHAHALHDEAEALLNKERAEELIVHADKVSRADTAGLQLLLAISKAAKERQIPLSWDQPSEKLVQVAAILGLNETLELH